jgi:uroporphyrinogen decarboxylase
LRALKNENVGRAPVWIMRQAGRYLPSYRKLRQKWPLRELFLNPELAAHVTLLPVDELGVDAAILFSDITIAALGFGLSLDFSEGPLIEPKLTPQDIPHLPLLPEALRHTAEAVALAKARLSVPLIAFAGGPFTVASYLIERHQGADLPRTKRWLYQDPASFHLLLHKITDLTIHTLRMQIEAGADAVQLFDSWAHVLSDQHLRLFSLPYLKRIIDALSAPVILFMRGSTLHAETLASLGPAAISLDWQKPMAAVRKTVPLPLQGNFDPDLLFAPQEVIQEEVRALIASMPLDPGLILNLGHGIKPDTPVEGAKALIEAARCPLL